MSSELEVEIVGKQNKLPRLRKLTPVTKQTVSEQIAR